MNCFTNKFKMEDTKIRGIAGIIKEKLTDMMTLIQNVYT